MVTVADITKSLPNWPDEVVELWLSGLANQWNTDWPPPEPLGWHRWAFILGHRPISWWRDVSWTLQKKDCSYSALCRDTKKIVDGTNFDISFGRPDVDTKQRYIRAYQHLLEHATFPEPLITIDLPDGVSVLDGNHRLAAYSFLRKASAEAFAAIKLKKPSAIQEVWVGAHARREVPLELPPDLD